MRGAPALTSSERSRARPLAQELTEPRTDLLGLMLLDAQARRLAREAIDAGN
jgi:hypothetical protein